MKNLRRIARKPGNDIHIRLGQKRKVQELERFSLISAGKGAALKRFRKNYCVGSRLLSSA